MFSIDKRGRSNVFDKTLRQPPEIFHPRRGENRIGNAGDYNANFNAIEMLWRLFFGKAFSPLLVMIQIRNLAAFDDIDITQFVLLHDEMHLAVRADGRQHVVYVLNLFRGHHFQV